MSFFSVFRAFSSAKNVKSVNLEVVYTKSSSHRSVIFNVTYLLLKIAVTGVSNVTCVLLKLAGVSNVTYKLLKLAGVSNVTYLLLKLSQLRSIKHSWTYSL